MADHFGLGHLMTHQHDLCPANLVGLVYGDDLLSPVSRKICFGVLLDEHPFEFRQYVQLK